MGRQARQPGKRRWLIWLLELLVIIGIIFGGRAWQQRNLIAGEAPAFDEIAMTGDELSLAAFRGKPVLLHFWASWCPMCELEQDGINRVAADWPVVTVAFASGEADEVRRYMERKGIENWTTVVDNDGELAKLYGVTGVPTTYVIDPDGNIRFREVGISSGWALRFRMWLADKMG